MKHLIIATSLLLPFGTSQASDYSAGALIGSGGIGATVSFKNTFSFREGDQIQTRFSMSGIGVDDADDMQFSGNDFEGDISISQTRATMNWYPFSGAARKVYFSTGIDYSRLDVDANTKNDKGVKIGNTTYAASDNISLDLDIEHKPVSPYIGVGWGDRIGSDNGFSFVVEAGLAVPTSNADVTLVVTDPNSLVTEADIATEKKQIEDSYNGVIASASVGVTYHF
jgi:hypothetical protein